MVIHNNFSPNPHAMSDDLQLIAASSFLSQNELRWASSGVDSKAADGGAPVAPDIPITVMSNDINSCIRRISLNQVMAFMNDRNIREVERSKISQRLSVQVPSHSDALMEGLTDLSAAELSDPSSVAAQEMFSALRHRLSVQPRWCRPQALQTNTEIWKQQFPAQFPAQISVPSRVGILRGTILSSHLTPRQCISCILENPQMQSLFAVQDEQSGPEQHRMSSWSSSAPVKLPNVDDCVLTITGRRAYLLDEAPITSFPDVIQCMRTKGLVCFTILPRDQCRLPLDSSFPVLIQHIPGRPPRWALSPQTKAAQSMATLEGRIAYESISQYTVQDPLILRQSDVSAPFSITADFVTGADVFLDTKILQGMGISTDQAKSRSFSGDFVQPTVGFYLSFSLIYGHTALCGPQSTSLVQALAAGCKAAKKSIAQTSTQAVNTTPVVPSEARGPRLSAELAYEERQSRGSQNYDQVVFSQRLEFSISVSDLPAETLLRVQLHACATIPGHSSDTKSTIIGWATMPLFDEARLLQRGPMLLKLLPDSRERLIPIQAINNSQLGEKCPTVRLIFPDFGRTVQADIDGVDSSQLALYEEIIALEVQRPINAAFIHDCLDSKGHSQLDEIPVTDQNRADIEECRALVRVVSRDIMSLPTRDECRLLWAHRYALSRVPHSLLWVLVSCPWTNRTECAEMRLLVQLWAQFADPALYIQALTTMVPDTFVRAWAVSHLDQMSDRDVRSYMLQFLQCVKGDSYHAGPVALWLLRRALQSPYDVGHVLYWQCTVEMACPQYRMRLGLLRRAYLLGYGDESERIQRYFIDQHTLVDALSSASRYAFQQHNSVRSAAAVEVLERYVDQLPKYLTLPTSPEHEIREIQLGTVRVMNSKKAPLMVSFANADPNGEPIAVLYKVGDDLRQDQLILQLMRIMDQRWSRQMLQLNMSLYGCTATALEEGMLEVVQHAETTAYISMKMKHSAVKGAFGTDTIANWLHLMNPGQDSYNAAVQRFASSLAGYCVATNVLGIGDRHNDNLMIKHDGSIFHIDFGWFLGRFKTKYGIKREGAPFVFTPDFAFVLGGKRGKPFGAFRDMATRSFDVLRQDASLYLSILSLCMTSGLWQLSTQRDIDWFRTQLHLELKSTEADEYFRKLISESLSSKRTVLNNLCHLLKHSGIDQRQMAKLSDDRIHIRLYYPIAGLGYVQVRRSPGQMDKKGQISPQEASGVFCEDTREEKRHFIFSDKRVKLITENELKALYPPAPKRALQPFLRNVSGTPTGLLYSHPRAGPVPVFMSGESTPACIGGPGHLFYFQPGTPNTAVFMGAPERAGLITEIEYQMMSNSLQPGQTDNLPSGLRYPIKCHGFVPVFITRDGRLVYEVPVGSLTPLTTLDLIHSTGQKQIEFVRQEGTLTNDIGGDKRSKLITEAEYRAAFGAEINAVPVPNEFESTGIMLPGRSGGIDSLPVYCAEELPCPFIIDDDTGGTDRALPLNLLSRAALRTCEELGMADT